MKEISGSAVLMRCAPLQELMAESQSSYIYPHLCVLPMGLSWALHLAHQAHRTLALPMLPGIQLVEDRTPVPRLRRDDCCLLLYADNANHLGTNASMVNRQRCALSEGCAKSGLLTHEIVEATTLAESLGVRVDGEQGTIGPTAERDWRLDRALRALWSPCHAAGV